MKRRNVIFNVTIGVAIVVVSFMSGRWLTLKEVQTQQEQVQQAQEEAQEHYINWFIIGVECMSQSLLLEDEALAEKNVQEIDKIIKENPLLEDEENFIEKLRKDTDEFLEEVIELLPQDVL